MSVLLTGSFYSKLSEVLHNAPILKGIVIVIVTVKQTLRCNIKWVKMISFLTFAFFLIFQCGIPIGFFHYTCMYVKL
jgi:hypothetical protein